MFMICTPYSLYLRRGLLCRLCNSVSETGYNPIESIERTLCMINLIATADASWAQLHINYREYLQFILNYMWIIIESYIFDLFCHKYVKETGHIYV